MNPASPRMIKTELSVASLEQQGDVLIDTKPVESSVGEVNIENIFASLEATFPESSDSEDFIDIPVDDFKLAKHKVEFEDRDFVAAWIPGSDGSAENKSRLTGKTDLKGLHKEVTDIITDPSLLPDGYKISSTSVQSAEGEEANTLSIKIDKVHHDGTTHSEVVDRSIIVSYKKWDKHHLRVKEASQTWLLVEDPREAVINGGDFDKLSNHFKDKGLTKLEGLFPQIKGKRPTETREAMLAAALMMGNGETDEDLQLQIDALDQQVSDLKAALGGETAQTIAEKVAKIAELETNLAEANSSPDLQGEVDRLTTELATANAALEAVTDGDTDAAALAAAIAEKATVEAELAAEKQVVTDLTAQLNESTTEKEAAEAKVATLTDEISTLNTKIADLEADPNTSDANKQVVELKKQLGDLETQLAQTKGELEAEKKVVRTEGKPVRLTGNMLNKEMRAILERLADGEEGPLFKRLRKDGITSAESITTEAATALFVQAALEAAGGEVSSKSGNAIYEIIRRQLASVEKVAEKETELLAEAKVEELPEPEVVEKIVIRESKKTEDALDRIEGMLKQLLASKKTETSASVSKDAQLLLELALKISAENNVNITPQTVQAAVNGTVANANPIYLVVGGAMQAHGTPAVNGQPVILQTIGSAEAQPGIQLLNVGAGQNILQNGLQNIVMSGLNSEALRQAVILAGGGETSKFDFGSQTAKILEILKEAQTAKTPETDIAEQLMAVVKELREEAKSGTPKAGVDMAQTEYKTAIADTEAKILKQVAEMMEANNKQLAEALGKFQEKHEPAETDPEIKAALDELRAQNALLKEQVKSLEGKEVDIKLTADEIAAKAAELKTPETAELTIGQLNAQLVAAEASLGEAKEALESLTRIDRVKDYTSLYAVLAELGVDTASFKSLDELRAAADKAYGDLEKKAAEIYSNGATPEARALAFQMSKLATARVFLAPENITADSSTEQSLTDYKAGKFDPKVSDYMSKMVAVVQFKKEGRDAQWNITSDVEAVKNDMTELAKEFKIDLKNVTVYQFIQQLEGKVVELKAKGEEVSDINERINGIKAAIAAKSAPSADPAAQVADPLTDQLPTTEASADAEAETVAEQTAEELAEEAVAAQVELKEVQVSKEIADLESSMNEIRKSLKVTPVKVKGWRKFAKGAAEIMTSVLGGSVGRAVIGGLVTAGMVGAGIATGGVGGLLIAAATGAAGGGFASGLFSSVVHYKVFNRGKHQILSEYGSKGNKVLSAFKNAGHEKIVYRDYKLDQRLGVLGSVYNKLAKLDLSDPNAYKLENLNAAGVKTEEVVAAFKQLYYVKEVSQFGDFLNDVRLPEGFKLDGVDNIQAALNRLLAQVPAIFEENAGVLNAEDIIKEVSTEIDADYNKALWTATKNKVVKGAVVGGITGTILQMMDNVQSGEGLLGQADTAKMTVDAATGSTAEATKDFADISQRLQGAQAEQIDKLATSINVSPDKLMEFAGPDKVFSAAEISKLDTYVHSLGGAAKESIEIAAGATKLPIADLPTAWQEGLSNMGISGDVYITEAGAGAWGAAQGEALSLLNDSGLDVTSAEGFSAWTEMSGRLAQNMPVDVDSIADKYGLVASAGKGIPGVAETHLKVLGMYSNKLDEARTAFQAVMKGASGVGGGAVDAATAGSGTVDTISGKIGDAFDTVGEKGPGVITGIGELPGKVGEGVGGVIQNRGDILSNIQTGLSEFGQNVKDFFTSHELIENLEQTGKWASGALLLQLPITVIGSWIGNGAEDSTFNPNPRKVGETVKANVYSGGQPAAPVGSASDDSGRTDDGSGPGTGGGATGGGNGPTGSAPAGRSGQSAAHASSQASPAQSAEAYRNVNFRNEARGIGDESAPKAWKKLLIADRVPGTNLEMNRVVEEAKLPSRKKFQVAWPSKEGQQNITNQDAAFRQLTGIFASGLNGEQGLERTVAGKKVRFQLPKSAAEQQRKQGREAISNASGKVIKEALGDTVDKAIAAELRLIAQDDSLADLTPFKKGLGDSVKRFLTDWRGAETPYETLRDVTVLTSYLSDERISADDKNRIIQGYLSDMENLPSAGSFFNPKWIQKGNTARKHRMAPQDQLIALAALNVAMKASDLEAEVNDSGEYVITQDSSRTVDLKEKIKQGRNGRIKAAKEVLAKRNLALDMNSPQVEILARLASLDNNNRRAEKKAKERAPRQPQQPPAISEALETPVDTTPFEEVVFG